MITPELTGHIRTELAKGKTREEIRKALITEGGWGETDLSEAFRIIIPVQSFIQNPVQSPTQNPVQSSTVQSNSVNSINTMRPFTQTPDLTKISSFSSPVTPIQHPTTPVSIQKILLIFIVCVVIGGAGAVWWFRPSLLTNTWDSLVNQIAQISIPYFNTPTDTNEVVTPAVSVVENTPVVPEVVKDCGVGAAPDLKSPKTYQNDAVLTCLGNSASLCQPARAVLSDPLFPTIIQITKNQDSCNFTLSYPEDSALMDITGKKLAGQYLSCPISIVKMLDETNPKTPVFKAPSIENLSKYASQIYFYGTLGLFMENDVDLTKIQNAGCSGSYINSVIASYNKTHPKK